MVALQPQTHTLGETCLLGDCLPVTRARDQELRRTGLENLLVEDSMKNLQGAEVKLPKLPKQLLKEPRDAEASNKMIQQLKDVSSKLGSEVCAPSVCQPLAIELAHRRRRV